MSKQTSGAGRPDSGVPFTIVSADSHVGLPAEEYRPYVDSKYRDEFDAYIEDNLVFQSLFHKLGYPFSPEVLQVIDKRGAITSGGVAGFFDAHRRLGIQADEGVVAEILHPGGPIAVIPWANPGTRRVFDELRAAGTTAYNRFLADFCSVDRKRFLGVAQTYPWPDVQAAANTVKWAAEQGMVAIYPPRFAGAENDLPPVYDRFWDPLWAACCEHGLKVHLHAGSGKPQGFMLERIRGALARAGDGPDALAQIFESIFDERRPLWQMMWAGVFDRFPELQVVFAEIRSYWIPPTLDALTRRNQEEGGVLKRSPWEYWQRNCAVTPTFMRVSDLDVREKIGLSKTMFGTDYPHAESTWPNTQDFLRLVLNDVPEVDARAILGDNAINFYGLDRGYLNSLASQYGPKPEEIIGQAQLVDSGIVQHLDHRNGLNKKVTYEDEKTATALDVDIETASAQR
ncbi:amidohydrolase family protein [Nocardia jiangxiensis]|uniref:amidohydrolase family protein n=1 Tax=Nocardia jiangxiensis TaxID=282685 RepID=UPI0002F46EF2|nr:amidohydrolase family protein [Nocardia jiangxiensis]